MVCVRDCTAFINLGALCIPSPPYRLILYTHHYSHSMPSSRISKNDPNAHSEPPTRQVGARISTERWWRDHYNEIAGHGYELRPRCHPKWQPSCFKSGKDFYTVEDSQANIVRLSVIIF